MVASVDTRSEQSVYLMLAVVGTAALGWVAMIGLHGLSTIAPEAEAMAALPPEVRAVLKFCGHSPDIGGAGIGNWILGWTLMVVAMMLPPALPLLQAGERLLGGREDRARLLLMVLLAFVGVWIVAGGLLFVAGSVARAAMWLLPRSLNQPAVAAAVAALAVGLFQFTAMKKACMDACRSPTAVMLVGWRGMTPQRSALRIGARYGAICVGCCWAMMLLGMLAGALMLPIMVICALMMTLERLVPVVRPLIPLQAGFAILVGVLLLSGVLPPAIF